MHLVLLTLGLSPLASAADTMPLVGEEILVEGVAEKPPKPSLQINILQYDLNTQVYTFPSGLRIMFQDDDTLPVVAITAVYDHGASEDPEDKYGLAHLMEHMWFRTEHGDLPATWQLLNTDLGCNLNAFTQYDITAYMSVCPSEHLDVLLRLESLRMAAPLEGVTEEMVETEIEVVRNEIRMRTENGNIPFFPVLEYINKLTYPEGHPYHRPMAGDHTTIRNVKLQDIADWIEPRYVPDSTTIMVVGDLGFEHPQDVITAILRDFDPSLLHPDLKPEHIFRFPKDGVDPDEADPDNPDDWWLAAVDPSTADAEEKEPLTAQAELPPRNTEYADVEPPPRVYDTLQEYESTVEDPTVIVTWSLPPGYQGNDTLMQLTGSYLSGIIAGSPNSPFGELSDSNMKEFGGCGALVGKQVSTMVCSATLKDGSKKPEQTAENIIDRLYLISNPDMQKFLKAELSRVRMELLADTFRSLDLYAAVGAGRATEIAQFAHFVGRPDYHTSQMNEAMSIQIEAIADMVQKYVTRDRASMAVIQPVDREDLQEVSADGSDHYKSSNQGSGQKFLIPTEAITPELVKSAFHGPDFSHVKEYDFSNGLKVVVVAHGEAPVARATLLTYGGRAQDLDGKDYLRYRSSATEWEDPLQIAGRIDWNMETSYEAMSVEASAGNLDGMLWMLRDAVDKMHIDLGAHSGAPGGWSSSRSEWVKKGREHIVEDFGDIDWHIRDMVNEVVNPDHPNYRPLTFDDYKRLKKVKKSELKAMMEAKWQPSNAVLLIVGNVEHDQALMLAKTYFGGWRAREGTPAYTLTEVPPPSPKKERRVLVFDKEGKTQTQVTLTCPAKYNPDLNTPSPGHSLMGTVLSNELSSILRETAGVVYSPYAYSSYSANGDARTVFGASVQNSAAGFTVETYYKLVDLIENGEFSNEQILQEKYSKAQKFVLQEQSMAQMSDLMEYQLGVQRDWGYLDRYAEALSIQDIDTLQEVMGSCSESSVVTLEGPADEITARLDEAGVTDYEVVDWEQRGRDIYAAQDPKGAAKAERKRLKEEAKAAKKGEDEEEDGDSH